MPDVKTPDRILEVDGMLWKPARGATATADEFISARTTFTEIVEDGRWNPWVGKDRAAEFDEATKIMNQWRRAEPGHRMLTMKQIEARWARQDRERERAHAKRTADREARKLLYDEQRADARLALLEHQSGLQHDLTELAAYEDGSYARKMDPTRREEAMNSLQQSIRKSRDEIAKLTPIVGDPETVIDQNGCLPSERRESLLLQYRFERERQVRRLRDEIPALAATIERKDQWKLDSERRKLHALLAVPPLTADDMCSDCATPIAQHGWTTPPFTGPCPAWPRWRARVQAAWKIFEAGIRETEAAKQQPPQPQPQPLAVIPSGLTIAEVMKQLRKLQRQYPTAEVRRGRANRWELWPSS